MSVNLLDFGVSLSAVVRFGVVPDRSFNQSPPFSSFVIGIQPGSAGISIGAKPCHVAGLPGGSFGAIPDIIGFAACAANMIE
jgi:hypothetical protein